MAGRATTVPVLKSYPRGDWRSAKHAQRGTWVPVTLDSKRTARFACPFCGFVAVLGSHTIDSDGIVSPSVVCDVDGCKFHEFIKLGGWRG